MPTDVSSSANTPNTRYRANATAPLRWALLLGRMQPGRVEGGADVRYVAGPERLGAQDRAEQVVHHPLGVGGIMRGGVVHGICQIRVAAVEVAVAEVVIPDAVPGDQVAHAVAPGCLAGCQPCRSVVVRDRIELSTFRFSGSSVPAGLSMHTVLSCDPHATSVLYHDRLRQLRRITVSRQS